MAEDEVTDNWEDLEDSGELDRRLDKIKVKPVTVKNNGCMSGTRENEMMTPALVEDTQRSVFTPQVKILKRNTAPNNAHQNASTPGGQSSKSLQERTTAYHEARMRIFGAAEAAEAEDGGEGDYEGGDGIMYRDYRYASEKVDYSGSVVARRFEGLRVGESAGVLRQPRGPDGSAGFSQRSTSVDR